MRKKTCSEIFSERLTELRQQHGETSRDLARALDISFSAISNYQLGKRTPDIVFLQKVALHYHVPSDYLLGLTDAQSIEQDIQNICNTTGLSESSIETLQDVVSDTEHTKYSAYTLDFLNGILEDESNPFSVSVLANMMQKIVTAKVKTKMIKNRIDINELERKKTGRPMNAYEAGDVFDLQDKREQEDLALLRFSKLLNTFAEMLANNQVEQEAQHAQHHETDE